MKLKLKLLAIILRMQENLGKGGGGGGGVSSVHSFLCRQLRGSGTKGHKKNKVKLIKKKEQGWIFDFFTSLLPSPLLSLILHAQNICL